MEKLYKLSEHIYILPFNLVTDRPNLGYIKGSEKVLMYDAGCGPKTIRFLKEELKENGLPYPDEFVISHFHWDHSFATAFTERKTYSSKYTFNKMVEMKEMQVRDTDELICDELMPLFCKDHLHMEYDGTVSLDIKEADEILAKETVFDLGDVKAEVVELENSHCPGSLVCYVPEDKVLFVGDSNSGYVKGYDFFDDFDLLRKFYDAVCKFDFETIVLGHFNPYSRAEYISMMEEKFNNNAK